MTRRYTYHNLFHRNDFTIGYALHDGEVRRHFRPIQLGNRKYGFKMSMVSHIKTPGFDKRHREKHFPKIAGLILEALYDEVQKALKPNTIIIMSANTKFIGKQYPYGHVQFTSFRRTRKAFDILISKNHKR